MKTERPPISQLYYKYGKTSDSEIRDYLKDIKIVIKQRKSYYPLNEEKIKKIIQKPRNISLTFDVMEANINNISLRNLEEYKTIYYLVKSTSRRFLKPDIGEIFDQIDFHDLCGKEFDARQNEK